MKAKKRGPMMRNVIDVPADPLLLPKMTAEMLGVKETTLTTWRSKKRYPLRFLKIGKLIRYRKSDVDAFLDFCSQGGLEDEGR
jgi:predicted DNA-binding transcriptional regulator AlpA